jgi:Xaa-Pro aminopeptidase
MNSSAVAKIRHRLRTAGLKGYVAATPSNVFYVTGFRSYFLSEWWRMHGTVFALVPADEAAPVTLVLSDFERNAAHAAAPDVDLKPYRLWVDLHTEAQLTNADGMAAEPPRPAQYDPHELDAAVAAALRELDMTSGAVGTDLPFLTVETYDRLRRVAPDATWTDLSDVVYGVRLIKEGWEVERLALGVELSEAGMVHAAMQLSAGMSAADVRLQYQAGVIKAAAADSRFAGYTDNWVLPSVGGRTSASYGDRGSGLQPGDLVKFDCGTTIDGYRCDGGRTFSFQRKDPAAERLYGVLAEAQRIARGMVRPGTVVGDIFRAAMAHVHANGYPAYNRGHIGHSVGIDTFHEEPPYITPDCNTVLEPGMVFAVELPTYTPDVGAIMIEDMLVVTDDGARQLHSLTHDLVVV